jgi:hypothetical protein
MTPNLLATTTLVTTRRAKFRVTPKGRTGHSREAIRVPRPLTIVLVLAVLAGLWYVATLLGWTPVQYEVPWAVHAAFAWMLFNVGLVWLAIRRVRSAQYAGERRGSVRFATDLGGRLDGVQAHIVDLSLTGGRVVLPADAAVAPSTRLTVDLAGSDSIELEGVVRSQWVAADGRTMIGFEFAPGQHTKRARLALALFATEPAATHVELARPSAEPTLEPSAA